MSAPYEFLLHPELLSNEQLIYYIRQRYLRIPDLEVMSREELLIIFHSFCVPFGQRQDKNLFNNQQLCQKINGLSFKHGENKNKRPYKCNDKSHHSDIYATPIKRINFDPKSNIAKSKGNINTLLDEDKNHTPPKKRRKENTWQ